MRTSEIKAIHQNRNKEFWEWILTKGKKASITTLRKKRAQYFDDIKQSFEILEDDKVADPDINFIYAVTNQLSAFKAHDIISSLYIGKLEDKITNLKQRHSQKTKTNNGNKQPKLNKKR